MSPAPCPRRRRRPWLAALVLLLAWPPLQVLHDVNVTRVERVQLTTAKLAAGTTLRVLQVSDFHALESERQIDQVIADARRLRPDVIALTGDFVHTHSTDVVMAERLVRGLRGASRQVFYVRGNHDNWNADWGGRAGLWEMLERVGVPVLDNEHVTVSGPFGEVEVLGTNDPGDGLDDLPAAAAGAEPARYWLLLTHDPAIGHALAGSGVDLAICGHTHGGQVRLPFIGALYAPGQGRFPHFDRGGYDEWGGPLLWIDSGMGWTSHPVRFLAQSQVSLYEIVGR